MAVNRLGDQKALASPLRTFCVSLFIHSMTVREAEHPSATIDTKTWCKHCWLIIFKAHYEIIFCTSISYCHYSSKCKTDINKYRHMAIIKMQIEFSIIDILKLSQTAYCNTPCQVPPPPSRVKKASWTSFIPSCVHSFTIKLISIQLACLAQITIPIK